MSDLKLTVKVSITSDEEEEMESCVKCEEKSVYNDSWGYCNWQGWYCPACAPTTSCDDESCECCYGFDDIEINLDSCLYNKNLDWGFEKPKSGNYHTVYIFPKEER